MSSSDINKSNIWYTEYHTKNSGITFKVKETLFAQISPFQEIVVMDTHEYGKVLLLDGLVMLTEKDEFIYHEMITHISMHLFHNELLNVLIIGGGDCGTLRELSRYENIKNITMVEIDKDVVEASKQHFPFLHEGIKNNSKILFDDGILFIKNTDKKFDLIIVDSTDPIGPGEVLFTDEFYKNCYEKLNVNGFLALQAESPYFNRDIVSSMHKRITNIGYKINPYLAYIPTYPSGLWQFFLCSKKNIDTKNINEIISKSFISKLKYYNHEIHKGCFALPNFIKDIYGI